MQRQIRVIQQLNLKQNVKEQRLKRESWKVFVEMGSKVDLIC